MLMGGNSRGERNITMCGEFNFHADPEAAKVVIDRMQCPICIVPRETCKNTNISWVSCTNSFSFGNLMAAIRYFSLQCDIIFISQILHSQDWRKHVLGNIDSPQIEFLNRIEEMWYTNRYEDTWIPCDLFTMSVFFDENIIQESDTYEVINAKFFMELIQHKICELEVHQQ